MADPTAVPNVVAVFQVWFESKDQPLTIVPPEQPIYAGDVVLWDFINLPAGWIPWISFADEEQSPFRGPFSSLRQSSRAIWGQTSAITSTAFTYVASVRPLDAVTATVTPTISEKSTLQVTVLSTPSTSPTFTVTYQQPDEEHHDGWLKVEPDTHVLTASDTVSWQLVGLPSVPGGWMPSVVFNPDPSIGNGQPPHLGPFTELVYEGTVLTGKGNTNNQGTYPFTFQVLRVLNNKVLWISSGDPAIDNRGEATPPDPPLPPPA